MSGLPPRSSLVRRRVSLFRRTMRQRWRRTPSPRRTRDWSTAWGRARWRRVMTCRPWGWSLDEADD